MRYIFILFVLFSGCSPENKDRVSPLAIRLSEFKLNNEKVISSIKSYIDSSSKISCIYAITIEREDLITTSYKLSTIASYRQVNETSPAGYFLLDDDLILVYTGLERIVRTDDRFKAELKNAIGNRIENDTLMVFCPSTRHYKLKGDSLIDMGTVFDPLGPPLNGKIKFVFPRVKNDTIQQ